MPQVQVKYTCFQRILVVDDEPMNIMAITHMMQMALKNLGHNPEILSDFMDTASEGTEAVNKFKAQSVSENPYVLIFMDCSMEPMDGYTATTLIKKFCQTSRIDPPYVVACTGHTEDQYVKKAWDSRMDELIPKPCLIPELEKVLNESMDFMY